MKGWRRVRGMVKAYSWSWLVKYSPLEDPLVAVAVLSEGNSVPSVFSSLICDTTGANMPCQGLLELLLQTLDLYTPAPPSALGLLSGWADEGWAAEDGEGGDG